jgi:hypothetical protein
MVAISARSRKRLRHPGRGSWQRQGSGCGRCRGGGVEQQDGVHRALAREGERGDLVVNTRELHFFDLETGDGIYA